MNSSSAAWGDLGMHPEALRKKVWAAPWSSPALVDT